MQPVTPSAFIEQFEALIGRSVVRVIRWLFEGDSDRPDFEQDADGPTILTFESGHVLHVVADPERQGLKVCGGEGAQYGDSYELRDVSHNPFWRKRLGIPLARIGIVKSDYSTPKYPSEFGLIFHFENGTTACLELMDTEDWPDTLRVCAEIDRSNARVMEIGGADSRGEG